MRVLACYNGDSLRSETYDALVKHIPVGALELVNVSGDACNYWHELRNRWTGEYDLVTVEQDNVITAETIPSFAACAEPWCCYEYELEDQRMCRIGLGCTRFSAELQRTVPVSEISGSAWFTWHILDYRVFTTVQRFGFEPHVHGQVEHLHDYNAVTNAIGLESLRTELGKLQAQGSTFQMTQLHPVPDGIKTGLIPDEAKE